MPLMTCKAKKLERAQNESGRLITLLCILLAMLYLLCTVHTPNFVQFHHPSPFQGPICWDKGIKKQNKKDLKILIRFGCKKRNLCLVQMGKQTRGACFWASVHENDGMANPHLCPASGRGV